MLDDVELRRMSPIERARLARRLASLEHPHPVDDRRFRLGRRVWLIITVGACFVLAAWIGVLAVTLPRHFAAGGWRVSWVGFDVALFLVFAVTAWAAWRCRQALIICLIVTATLLLSDAWFDLSLDWGTKAFMWSLLSAVFAEVPVAVLMIIAARRMLRLTVRAVMAREGYAGPVPPLWRLALFGPMVNNDLAVVSSNDMAVVSSSDLAVVSSSDMTVVSNDMPSWRADNQVGRPTDIAAHGRGLDVGERPADRRSA